MTGWPMYRCIIILGIVIFALNYFSVSSFGRPTRGIEVKKFFDKKINKNVKVVANEILVKFSPSLSKLEVASLNSNFNATSEEVLKFINVHRVKLQPNADIGKVIQRYERNPNVIYAEPNFILKGMFIPNEYADRDELIWSQWGLGTIMAPEAWDKFNIAGNEFPGENIVVAVLDTGADYNHLDLQANIWENLIEKSGAEGVDDDNNGYVDDVQGWNFNWGIWPDSNNPDDNDGHGTNVTGIIAAVTNNNFEVAGLSWGSKVMVLKVSDIFETMPLSNIINAIGYAVDNDAKVISMSLGTESYSGSLEEAVNAAFDSGCVLVAAAGNEYNDVVIYPAGYSCVIAVGATNRSDIFSWFSSFGNHIDVCAPGSYINSTYPTKLGAGPKKMSGTSQATPHVSALAALLLSVNETLTPSEVRSIIRKTADKIDSDNYPYNQSDVDGTRNDRYGHGRINAYKALVSIIPVPSVSANYSSFALSPGEQQTVTFTVANDGAETSLYAYLTISVSNGLDIVGWSSDDGQYSGSNPNGMRFSHKYPGNSDYDKDGNPITLQDELLDCYEKYDQNETRTVTVTFKGNAIGSQWIKYRATFDDVAEGTYYVNDPASSGYTDQQGWNVYLIPVSGGNPPTSISVTENLNPSTCPSYTSVKVSGKAIYNNNPDWPVSAGTALIEISGVNTWTAALDSNGNYSRQITAPGSLGTYTVKVTVSDGSLSGSTQKNLTITGEGGGTGYTFLESTVCRDVQASEPWDPIYEINAFGDDDARVYVWANLTADVDISCRMKFEWYRPSGSLYGTYTSDWYDVPSGHRFIAWSYYNISGTERADIEGEWSVKIYVDGGSGFDYKATEYFTIRYNLTEHKMCQDVQASQPYDPINPTNTFHQTDGKAMTWMSLDDVSNSLEVKWDFYEPNGNLYTTFTFTTDDPNSGGYDYWDYRCWGWIGINGNSAASKCGDWEVKVYIKNASGSWDHKYTDYFKILESPNVNPTASVSASPGSPTEADSVSLQINASDNTYLKKIILYWNDGTGHSKTWDNVIATSYSPSHNIGTYSERQEIEYYARAYDTSGNFTESAHRTLIIQDSDTSGPVISDVKVEEYNGNGNSNIEEGEQIKISWSLSDPNGISSTSIFVEGVEKTVQGTYYSIIDPYPTGSHSYAIIATDNDTSPATSNYGGSFTVGLITSYVNATIGNDNYDGSSPTYEGANVGPKKSIQAGIDASVGTCYVAAGTYYENVSLKHGVKLLGEGPDVTTIIAHEHVVLGADGSTIAGFKIANDGQGTSWGYGWSESATTIKNNVFIGHYVGIHCGQTGSKEIIVNNVIINNRNGITFGWDASPVIKNNILVNNGIHYYTGGEFNPKAAISYNNVYNGTYDFTPSPGTGNISVHPMFVDYSNYHLQQDSPCMDAGDPASDYSNEPEPNGNRINMGAYGNTEKATLTKIPEVLKVTLSDPDPVKASTNFVITVQFNKTLDTSVEPSITLNSTGSTDPSVPSGGHWSSSARANDTYTTPLIVLDSTMEGEITILIANAQDRGGNVMFPDSPLTFTLDATPPTASISISPVSPLKTGKVNVNLLISDASEILKTPSLSYRPFGGSLINIPLTGSDKNWSGSFYIESITPEGTAEFTWFGADAAGNSGTTIALGGTFEIDTTINASSDGNSSNSDGSKVDVPAGTFSEDVNIRITAPPSDSPLIRDADANIGDDLSIRPIVTESTAREIIAESDSTSKEIKDFKGSIIITIPYLDENQDGIVDGTEIKENSLKMFYLDENTRKWIPIGNSEVNPICNNVTTNVSHLSIFCIMAYIQSSDFTNVTVFPNPWYSDKHRAENIRIANLPVEGPEIIIYVYNIAGELVRTLREGEEIEKEIGSKVARWDCKNEYSRDVASGIYIYLITSNPGKKAQGKIAVIR